jgi:DNA-binding SARP family transcriptional activator
VTPPSRASGPRRLLFLGGAEIRAGEEPVGGRAAQRHRIALIALLAGGGRAITRDKAIAYLWPERDTDAGRNLLKVSVHELRKEIGEEAIRSVGDQLTIDASLVNSDVADFAAAIASGNDAEAVALYRGPFLDGFFLKDAEEFERWAESERARYAAACSGALERLLAKAEKSLDAEAALEWSRRLLSMDAYKADIALRHIKALASTGNAAGAIRFAEQFVTRRREALAIEDKEGIVAAARTLADVSPAELDTLSLEVPPIAKPGSGESPSPSLSPPHPSSSPTPPPSPHPRWLAVAIVAVLIIVIGFATKPFASKSPDDLTPVVAGRSEAATRAFLSAHAAYSSARYSEAESLYAKALDADSTFGAAGLGLAMANSWTTINESYGRGRDAAKKYESSLTARDRVFFRAFFGPDPAFAPVQPAPAYLAAWEDVVEKWPDWAEAWYQLGDRYYHFGGLSGLADHLDRARTAFQRAIGRDPGFAAPLHHLVELYAQRGDKQDLRIASDEYFSANPSVQRDRSAMGWEVAYALDDKAWLDRVRANFTSFSREDLRRIGWLTVANGWPHADADSAAKLLVKGSAVSSEREHAWWLSFTLGINSGNANAVRAAAAGLDATFPDRPIGATWRLYAALFGSGDSTSAAEAARALEPFVNAPPSGDHIRREHRYGAMCALGLWRGLTGNAAGEEAVLKRLRDEAPRDTNSWARRSARICSTTLAADLAVRAKKTDARASVAALDTLLLSERVPPSVLLEIATITAARLYLQLDDAASALVAARRREHLTGDPFFRSTQLKLEAEARGALDRTLKPAPR